MLPESTVFFPILSQKYAILSAFIPGKPEVANRVNFGPSLQIHLFFYSTVQGNLGYPLGQIKHLEWVVSKWHAFSKDQNYDHGGGGVVFCTLPGQMVN